MPPGRYHHVIFVETGSDGSGVVHEVSGDLTVGMKYQTKESERPEDSEAFLDKEHIGVVKAEDWPARMNGVLAALPPPPRQKAFNVETMRTEQVRPDGGFYSPGEPRPPMIKCTEWTNNEAIPSLFSQGIIRKDLKE